jgi:hypothetical protein
MAFFIFSNETFSLCVNPANPPAKVSPAPVGSKPLLMAMPAQRTLLYCETKRTMFTLLITTQVPLLEFLQQLY